MKKYIDLWQYAGQIMEQLGKGVLVTAKAEGRVNPMTIGWGTLGVEWKKPIFTVFVRQSRYTKSLLDKNGEFTINVPVKSADVKQILGFCGSKSGRDVDKVTELGLHLEKPEVISVPGIRELPITLECRVIYQQDQNLNALDASSRSQYYKPGTADEADYHTAYYGEVLAAYMIED